jgi:hypothetical protein
MRAATRRGELDAVDGEGVAGGDGGGVGVGEQEGAGAAHLLLEQPGRGVFGLGLERVGADEFGEVGGLVGFGGAVRAHLVEVDLAAAAGGLQGGFGAGEPPPMTVFDIDAGSAAPGRVVVEVESEACGEGIEFGHQAVEAARFGEAVAEQVGGVGDGGAGLVLVFGEFTDEGEDLGDVVGGCGADDHGTWAMILLGPCCFADTARARFHLTRRGEAAMDGVYEPGWSAGQGWGGRNTEMSELRSE